MSQIYLEVGYDFIPQFGVALGLHKIDGPKDNSYNYKLNASAVSLGLDFGF